ncbi:CBO0543 family protein [Cytobacillus sp. FJAT-53684]|uniref:CBO0543 family protein n=1 Tax=Cytobacillus mangrovibacter TaxID=3299024 RepID=A0ABW6K191_9BACI
MSIEEGIKQSKEAYDLLTEVNSLLSDAVVNAYIFTWRWWLGVSLFIIPWILWLIFRKRDIQGRLFMAGIVSILLSIIIDLVALSKGLWSYPVSITTIAPLLFLPYHFSLTPVVIMFFLQIKPRVNPIIKGIVFAALAAFGGMKFFEMIDLYESKGWSTFYDFFIFLTIYFVAYLSSSIGGYRELSDDS